VAEAALTSCDVQWVSLASNRNWHMGYWTAWLLRRRVLLKHSHPARFGETRISISQGFQLVWAAIDDLYGITFFFIDAHSFGVSSRKKPELYE
jgi:hypothetical protein